MFTLHAHAVDKARIVMKLLQVSLLYVFVLYLWAWLIKMIVNGNECVSEGKTKVCFVFLKPFFVG